MTEETQRLGDELNRHVAKLGDFIDEHIPDSREKSIMLTKLQECQLWGMQAIFVAEEEEPDA